MNFFKALLTPNSGISSKRFISIVALLATIVFSALSIYYTVEVSIIYTFASITTGSSVSTVFEKKVNV